MTLSGFERLRRHAGSLVVDSFFHGISRAGRLHPNADPARHGVDLVEDVAYVDSGLPEHRLDVYRPHEVRQGRSETPLPIVLYVHGGGFRLLSKDTHWVMALAFARRGFVVFNISYRLAPRHPFPAAIEDACSALRWVVDNAPRFGGDPERIVLAGESAGANLITGLTIATSYARPEPFARAVFETGIIPKAVLPACGILQVSEPGRFRKRWPSLSPFIEDRIREVNDAYLGRIVPNDRRALDLADPLVVLERGEAPARPLPPFFAICGTKDPVIGDTQRLERALTRLGVECRACYYPGERHAFHAFLWRPNALRCWAETYRFLDRHVGVPRRAQFRAAAG